MNNTTQILLNWDKGQTFAERMAAKILGIEGYINLDPQCPAGGPDGTKDILCQKDGKDFVAGCYFPNGQKEFKEIKEKFADDFKGVQKNSAQAFAFVTNQKITPAERLSLKSDHPDSDILHGERVCGILDSPKGYGIRLEYLSIPLSKEEQISFLDSHLNLEAKFAEISKKLDKILKVSVAIEGYVNERDILGGSFKTILPIAGISASCRLSVEDLFAIHVACMYEQPNFSSMGCGSFRKTEVWIGRAGCKKTDADFIGASPESVPALTHDLLDWWRSNFQKTIYANENAKIQLIAEFHAKFLAIHPFLDGNGRVSRALATLQSKDLLSKSIAFEKIDDRDEYYSSLQLAQQQGDYKQLIAHLESLIK